MTRLLHKLSEAKIKAHKAKGLIGDGGGLYLAVKSSGSKSWSFIWKKDGRRREMGLGPYPSVGLARARKKAALVREAIADGRDPIAERKKEAEPFFGECAEEFIRTMESQWRNEKHRAQWRMTLKVHAAPLSNLKVSEVCTDDILKILTPLWTTRPETASRLRGRIERVLNYAKTKGWRAGENPALWRGHLQNVLPARQKLSRGHHPAMPYSDVPAFMQSLTATNGIAASGLKLLILTAARSGEVRLCNWPEFDLNSKIWTIPAQRMKAGKKHRVPLVERAVCVIDEMREKRISDFVFPGQKMDMPLSEMAFSNVLKRLVSEKYTVHGFRSAFRDWAGDKSNFSREVVESALAHTIGNETERAYRRSDAIEKRRKLMEEWANFCMGSSATHV